MAEKQAPSRRGGASTQNAPRRNDVIRCDNCGEHYLYPVVDGNDDNQE